MALAGALSLAVAMGVGRFAFTPILPLMLTDGVIDLHGASTLATANYVGYLIGALLCTLQPQLWAQWPGLPTPDYASLVRLGLVGTTVMTLAMTPVLPALWPLWRLLAGVVSAIGFVYTAGWCLARVAELGRPRMGGLVFAGPGLGIVFSGLLGGWMAKLHLSQAWAWAAFAGLGAVLTAVVWPVFRGGAERLKAAAPARATAAPASRTERWLLALAYGQAGFGYIITATFLPVIAREELGQSPWIDRFWPVFGLSIAVGAVTAACLPASGDRRLRLILCHLMQAAGIVVTLWWPSPAGFIAGCVLLGLPFTALTFFAMQEARHLQPESAAALMGLMTSIYGLGQIAGPPLVAWRLSQSATAVEGFRSALTVAVLALMLGAVLYALMIWRDGGRRR